MNSAATMINEAIKKLRESYRLIKLVNGDTLIGSVIDEQGDVIIVRNPYKVVSSINPTTKDFEIGIYVWMPLTDSDDISIVHYSVLAYAPPSAQLMEYYETAKTKVYNAGLKLDEPTDKDLDDIDKESEPEPVKTKESKKKPVKKAKAKGNLLKDPKTKSGDYIN